MTPSKLTGIILAGGQSSRMGQTKALVDFRDRPLIDYPIALLKKTCNQVFIVTRTPELFKKWDVPTIVDTLEEVCPLSGLFEGLKTSSNPWSLVVACDMPYIREELIQGLFSQIPYKTFLEAIVPVGPSRQLNPLCALYSKSCLPVLHSRLKSRDYSLLGAISQMEAATPLWNDLDPQDTEGISFTNINDAMELFRATHTSTTRVFHRRPYC